MDGYLVRFARTSLRPVWHQLVSVLHVAGTTGTSATSDEQTMPAPTISLRRFTAHHSRTTSAPSLASPHQSGTVFPGSLASLDKAPSWSRDHQRPAASRNLETTPSSAPVRFDSGLSGSPIVLPPEPWPHGPHGPSDQGPVSASSVQGADRHQVHGLVAPVLVEEPEGGERIGLVRQRRPQVPGPRRHQYRLLAFFFLLRLPPLCPDEP